MNNIDPEKRALGIIGLVALALTALLCWALDIRWPLLVVAPFSIMTAAASGDS